MATLLGAQSNTYDLEGLTNTGALNGTNDFRLSLTSGTAVTTSDVTAATTIYLTPYKGNRIALYDGSSAWSLKSSAEVSLALGTISDATNYDVFAYLSGGNLTLEAVAWTNATTRATALALTNGVYLKTGTLTKRYVGTFRTTSTTTTEDSLSKRFLWNADNRVDRTLISPPETTDTWTYTTATYRQANANTANKVEVVIGLSIEPVDILAYGIAYSSVPHVVHTGVGVDSTSVNSAQIHGAESASAQVNPQPAWYRGYPGIGYHYLAWLEYSAASGTTTWEGDANAFQAGMIGGCMA